MASLRRERLSFSEKYKAITKVESGTKASLEIQYQHGCSLEIKEN